MITVNPINRCSWVTKDQIYIDYHDKEWGVPIYEDNKIFEFLILEGAQAGLNWLTTDIPHELRVNFLFVKFLNEKIFLPKILQHFHFKIA